MAKVRRAGAITVRGPEVGTTGLEFVRGRSIADGSVGSVVVVVDVPHLQGLGAQVFAGPGARVEELLCQDSVVALDLPVVAWVYGVIR